MLDTIKNFFSQFSYNPEIENSDQWKKYSSFLVAGMGGSHLAADLLKVWNPGLDLIIHQDYGLPPLAERYFKDRLIILSSYSGNTEEIIDAFEEAGKRNLPRAVISTGGKLLELAKNSIQKKASVPEPAKGSILPFVKGEPAGGGIFSPFHKGSTPQEGEIILPFVKGVPARGGISETLPYIQIPDTGIQPRSAVGFMFRALLKIMGEEDALKEVAQLSKIYSPFRTCLPAGRKGGDRLRGGIFSPFPKGSTSLEGRDFASEAEKHIPSQPSLPSNPSIYSSSLPAGRHGEVEKLQNQGQNLAKKLQGRVPVIYSSAKNAPLAANWKVRFNETAKTPAFYNVFPELNHNEMSGLIPPFIKGAPEGRGIILPSQKSSVLAKSLPSSEVLPLEKGEYLDTSFRKGGIMKWIILPFVKGALRRREGFLPHFLFLKDPEDHPRIIKRMAITEKLFSEAKLPVETIDLEGNNVFEKIFFSIHLADWTAYYLANHYKVDPEQVALVERFKDLMQS